MSQWEWYLARSLLYRLALPSNPTYIRYTYPPQSPPVPVFLLRKPAPTLPFRWHWFGIGARILRMGIPAGSVALLAT